MNSRKVSNGKSFEHTNAAEFRDRDVFRAPFDWSASRASFFRDTTFCRGARVSFAQCLIISTMLRDKLRFAVVA